jgi:hypothetical protein
MRSTLMLAIGLWMSLHAAAAPAATTGRVCRHACGPRILEQCGELAGGAFRRCRRPLVRACKAATPEVACSTTAQLTRALGDRSLDLAPGILRLCADGQFVLVESPGAVPVRTEGDWRIELADDALVVALDVNGSPIRSREIQPDGSGSFVVDGTAVSATDATDACAPPVVDVAPDPVLDLRDPERVLATTRAITDRTLVRTTFDAAGQAEIQALTLCSSGVVQATKVPITLQPEFDQGTWTVDETGTEIDLELERDLLPESFEVIRFDDGRLLLDGDPVDVNDARIRCDELDLETRFTSLLTRSAYSFTNTVANFTIRTTIVLCTPERFVRRTNIFVQPTAGPWTVEATDGVAVLRMVDAASGDRTELPLELADDGTLLLNGEPPVDDPDTVIGNTCDA